MSDGDYVLEPEGGYEDYTYDGGSDPAPQHQQQADQQLAHEAGRRIEAEARNLLHDHPELSIPGVAERTIGAAHEVARQLGVPHLGDEPEFVRLVHTAVHEGVSQPQAAQTDEAGQIKARIVSSFKSKNVLPF